MWACENNMESIASKLLDFPDINYNQINNEGETALILACKNNMQSIASKLLKFQDIII